jgi:hypothetical protein
MTSRVTSQFTVFKKWNFQAGLNYRAPRVTTQGRDLALYYADLGLSRDVLKGNGTVTLSVRDLFNTRKYRTIIDRPDMGYTAQRSFQWRTRQLRLTFSYRLNLKKQNVDREGGRMDEEEDS